MLSYYKDIKESLKHGTKYTLLSPYLNMEVSMGSFIVFFFLIVS